MKVVLASLGFVLGCAGAMPMPRAQSPDAPDAAGVPCDYPDYAVLAETLRERAQIAGADDRGIDRITRIDAAQEQQDLLLKMDRIRVACRVEVTPTHWRRAVERGLHDAEERILERLRVRAEHVDPARLETLEGELLDPDTLEDADRALAAWTEAVRLSWEQRRDVLEASIDDPCVVDRVGEMEAWREIAWTLRQRDRAPDAAIADEIASALAWQPTDVVPALERAASLEVDGWSVRRERAADVGLRCTEPLPIELIPTIGR